MSKRTIKVCKIDGCEKPKKSRGWCDMHYNRWRRNGDPELLKNAGLPSRCTIEGCGREVHGRGWCEMHYKRWGRDGSPGERFQRKFSTPEEALKTRVAKEGECLVWTGYRNRKGYGQINVGGKMIPAHRFAYEKANGTIPIGLDIDHMCWNPSCVNVDHLRTSTRHQNLRNRSGAQANNTSSGARNVYRHGNGWQVQIQKSGEYNYFGTYSTIEEAAEVAEKARRELFGEFAGRG